VLLIENFFMNWSQCFASPKASCKECPSRKSVLCLSTDLVMKRLFMIVELVLCLLKASY
jgi:hypothetical protein